MKNSEETGSPGPGRKTSLLFAQMTAATLLIGFEWVQNTGACSARPRRRRGTRDSKPKKKTRGRRFAEISPRLRRKERPELLRAREDAEHFAGQPRGPGKSLLAPLPLPCSCWVPAASAVLFFKKRAKEETCVGGARVFHTCWRPRWRPKTGSACGAPGASGVEAGKLSPLRSAPPRRMPMPWTSRSRSSSRSDRGHRPGGPLHVQLGCQDYQDCNTRTESRKLHDTTLAPREQMRDHKVQAVHTIAITQGGIVALCPDESSSLPTQSCSQVLEDSKADADRCLGKQRARTKKSCRRSKPSLAVWIRTVMASLGRWRFTFTGGAWLFCGTRLSQSMSCRARPVQDFLAASFFFWRGDCCNS